MTLGEGTVVIGPAQCRTLIRNDSANREWTTVVEAISAAGRVMPPLVIFKGQSVQEQWFPVDDDEVNAPYDDWAFKASPKGWTSDPIGLAWPQDRFLPHTRPAAESQWRVLILDGHRSHIQGEFMISCLENKVFLVYEPPHSSHILQPLDVGRFGVLKRRFRRELDKACAVSYDSYVRKGDFLRAWAAARSDSLKERVIQGGWAATGIFPRDITKPMNNRLRRSATVRGIEIARAVEAGRQEDKSARGRIVTPRTSRQVKDLGSAVLGGGGDIWRDPTKQLMFSKLGKGLDDLTARLRRLEQEILI